MLRHKSTTIGLQCNDCRKSARIINTCTIVHLFHLFQIPVMNCVCFFKPDFLKISTRRLVVCGGHAVTILEPFRQTLPFLLGIAKFLCLFGSISVQKQRQHMSTTGHDLKHDQRPVLRDVNLTSLNHDSGDVISGRRRGGGGGGGPLIVYHWM